MCEVVKNLKYRALASRNYVAQVHLYISKLLLPFMAFNAIFIC